MTNPVTTLRTALVADLKTRFPAAEVLSGPRAGKSVDKPRIVVFWERSGEQPGRVVVGESRIVIRYWPKTTKVRDDQTSGVRDPGELEQAGHDLQAFLQTKQTAYTAAGAWFVRLLGVEPDYDPDEWGVQAVMLVVADNPAVLV